MAKTCKYYKEKQLVSYDSGNTWQPTGLTRRGNLYESDSADCGYMTQYKWEVVSGYVCDVTTYTKYEKTQKFKSLDGGQTWEAVVPALYGRGNVLEYNSTDCGYEPPIDYSDIYLTFIPISAATRFRISRSTVSYSLDEGATWTPLASSDTTPLVQAGQKIMWKGTNDGRVGTFSSSDKFDVEGNSMSLIYGDNFRNQTSFNGRFTVFYRLFSGSSVVSAENMILPATTLTSDCYREMFQGCTSLTVAPQLPATTLERYCYTNMFLGCQSLTTVPTLSATTLAESCYMLMFSGCTSLTTVPTNYLPVTTLADSCYDAMFRGCTSLQTAPELPATTLAEWCYGSMFSGCRSLTVAPQLPATTLADSCYQGMFASCTSLTTTPQLPATTVASHCCESMFIGCSGLTTSMSVLPATTLERYCYYGMFEGCTSLTTAPTLSATTLASNCCYSMFSGCTSLQTVPTNMLPATTLAESCYCGMFSHCTSLTTAPKLPATTLADWCYASMFEYCSSLTTAPVLSATTLADTCYAYMFADCTSLTTAPQLPAPTLVYRCYEGIFISCSQLSSITCLATDISASMCTYEWVRRVAENGTFTKASSMTSWVQGSGASGIPNNWTVQNY